MDYGMLRSDYLRVMMGERDNALAPYRPEQMNDLGDTSFDVAALSDDDINLAINQMTGTKYEGTDIFKSLQTEQSSRKEKVQSQSAEKPWWENVADFFSNIGTAITEGVFKFADSMFDYGMWFYGGLLGGGWFGAKNDFTDWVANVMADNRWVDYATKGATLLDVFNKDIYYNGNNYWTDWSYENLQAQKEQNWEGLGGKDGVFRNILTGVGEMLPSMVLAYFTGGAAPAAMAAVQGSLGFARGAGGSVSQAMQEGASFQQASAYGALTGSVEAAFSAGSAAIGGMLASKGSQGFIDRASNKFGQFIGKRLGQSVAPWASKAMNIILDGFEEATEEVVEGALDPAFKSIYDSEAIYKAYGTSENAQAYLAELGKTALIAAAGSAIMNVGKTAIDVNRIGVEGIVNNYKREIETSENFKKLKKAGEGDLARQFVKSQVEYAQIEAEEAKFQRDINDIVKKHSKPGEDGTPVLDAEWDAKVKEMLENHAKSYMAKYTDWATKYADVQERVADVLKPNGSIPTPVVIGQTDINGKNVTYFEPKFTSIEDLETVLTKAQSPDAETHVVRLPLSDADVFVDTEGLSKSEISKIATIKSEDMKTSDSGSTDYAVLSDSKILVFDGEDAGVVEATLSDDGSHMVYNINGEEITVKGMVKSPSDEVDRKYGSEVKNAPASLVIEAANAKEGKTFSYTSTVNLINNVDEYIKNIVEGKVSLGDDNLDAIIDKINRGEELPDEFGKKAEVGIKDLTSDFFAKLNLSSTENKTLVKNYLESEILDTKVTLIDEDGNKTTSELRNFLTTDEVSDLHGKIDQAFNELMENGRTSRYSRLMEEFNSRLETMMRENQRIRDRAKLASKTTQDFNSLRNKLGLNGKPEKLKSILKGGSSEDIAIIDFFRGLVRDTNLVISSRTGLSTSPVAAQRLVDWSKDYTYEKLKDSHFWSPAIKAEMDAIADLAPERTRVDRETGAEIVEKKYSPYGELSIEVQQHIDNLIRTINKKLSDESQRIFAERKAIATDGVTLYYTYTPARSNAITTLFDRAEGLATYFANYLGKENPAYGYLVTDWAKANGTKLSYQQKYNDFTNGILKEEGFTPSSYMRMLKKKVTFKGEKITLGEAASIYYSALTKKGILDGTNEVSLDNPKTNSRSINFRLEGKKDLDALKSLFSENEMKVLDRLTKEGINGKFKEDFLKWYEKKYGFTPELSEDYFMLQGSNTAAEVGEASKAFGAGSIISETWGRAKQRQTYNGAYRIIDFASQYSKYTNDLAHFIGYTDYDDQARIVLNTKVEIDGHKYSLSELLGKKAPDWAKNKRSKGKTWLEYFQYVATDSRGFDDGMGGGLFGRVFRGGQTSVLGLNPRSMAKQWLSDFTVMGDVGIGTYLKSKTRVPYNLSHYKQVKDFMMNASNLIDTTDPDFEQYEPYFALIRDRFENKGLVRGELSTDAIGKISDIALKGMSFFDEANNVINVWSVAETLAHDYDKLAYGTRANKLQAMKYFTDLIFRTQSNNNAMYVSQLRSGAAGNIRRMIFGMFASDNQNKLQQVDSVIREFSLARKRKQGYQTIVDDINSTPKQVEMAKNAIASIDKNYSKKAWAKKASGVMAGLAMSGVGAALINELFDRLLAKKDKDGNVRKISDGLDWETVLREAPLEVFVNWIPYVSTFSNAFMSNNDISFFTVDRVQSLVDSSKTLFSALSSGKNQGKAITQFIITYSQLLGLPLDNVYKYAKGIVRNISEKAYINAFGWMESLSNNSILSSYKTLVSKNDISGAADVLSISYSMYKSGVTDRSVLVEVSKLGREGYNAIARNIPDYITNEDGSKAVLTEDQKTDFASVYSRSNKQVYKLVKSAPYQRMDSATKAKSIKKVYDLYYDAARYHSLGIEPSSKLGKLLAFASDYDADILATLMLIQQNSELADNRRLTKKEQALKIVNQQAMTKDQKLLTLYLMGYGVSNENKKRVRNYLIGLGFTKKQAEEFLPS